MNCTLPNANKMMKLLQKQIGQEFLVFARYHSKNNFSSN